MLHQCDIEERVGLDKDLTVAIIYDERHELELLDELRARVATVPDVDT